MTKFIGDITHTEKFKNKEGEEKTKYTKVWALFYNEEKGYYSVNFLGQWLSVFPKREKDTTANFEEEVKKWGKDEIKIEDIPF